MSTDIVVATTSFSRGNRSVVKGETFWAEDPFVRDCDPSLFGPLSVDNDVEQATAAPGEKRRGRPKKTAAPGGEQPETETAEETGAAED